ncbi:MAG TPA: HEAT repeat domain-containing protein, partial [Gemmataceae bacterium]|nr:HEAT repeat domain-containing protein [Gemmataceae bacterium]
MPRFRRPFSAVWLCTCLLAVLAPRIPLCYGAFDPVIDSPMYDAPRLPAPGVEFTLPEETIVLWLKALKRPEADMRRLAADAVVLAQRRGEPGVLGRGAAVLGLPTAPLGPGPLLAAFAVVPVNPRMPDLDRFIESLSQTLDQPDQHPAVRLAAARALIALNVQSSAPSLFQHSQSDGEDMREVVEPALARWNYRPARTVWMARLRDAATPQRSLVLAIQGLKAVGEPLAGDPLQEIALSASRAAPIRLEAARALGTLRTDGLEHDADSLAADAMPSGLLGRLLAVALLRRHRSENAVQLLQRLAADAEPTVAAPAVARLLEIDPDLVTPTVGRLLASPDANLRSEAVDALYSRPTLDGLDLLAARLEDDDPAVRVQARAALLRLADNPEFRDRVIADASRVLEETKDHWRGLEQATILLTQ